MTKKQEVIEQAKQVMGFFDTQVEILMHINTRLAYREQLSDMNIGLLGQILDGRNKHYTISKLQSVVDAAMQGVVDREVRVREAMAAI